jgi:hypothetical protein
MSSDHRLAQRLLGAVRAAAGTARRGDRSGERSADVITAVDIQARPLVSVKDAAQWCGSPERSLRAARAGELAHVAVAVGRRRYVRTSELLEW